MATNKKSKKAAGVGTTAVVKAKSSSVKSVATDVVKQLRTPGEMALGMIIGGFANKGLDSITKNVKFLQPDPLKADSVMEKYIKPAIKPLLITAGGVIISVKMKDNQTAKNIGYGMAGYGALKAVNNVLVANKKPALLGLGTSDVASDYTETEEELARIEAKRTFRPKLPAVSELPANPSRNEPSMMNFSVPGMIM